MPGRTQGTQRSSTMLKITVSNTSPGTTFVLSGRLAGPWVEEVRRCWLEAEAECRDKWRVDLRETTHVDAAGKALLSEMFQRGATFEATGCLTRALVESLAVASAQASKGGLES